MSVPQWCRGAGHRAVGQDVARLVHGLPPHVAGALPFALPDALLVGEIPGGTADQERHAVRGCGIAHPATRFQHFRAEEDAVLVRPGIGNPRKAGMAGRVELAQQLCTCVGRHILNLDHSGCRVGYGLGHGLSAAQQQDSDGRKAGGAVGAQWRPFAASQRSASRAAMQPEPAAVMAWRYVLSQASPLQKTPSTLV